MGRPLLIVGLVLVANSARAEDGEGVTVNGRLSVGGGTRLSSSDDRGGLTEFSVRVAPLFDLAARVGPAVELRTASFSTIEGLAGATLALPMRNDENGFLFDLGGGLASRPRGDGAVVRGAIGWGLLHTSGRLTASTTLYVAAERIFAAAPCTEVTAGVAFGAGLTTAIFRAGMGSL